MTEAEILSNAIQAAQATAAIFSLFLTIVSAYIAALYFFLNRAPCLRTMAFALLSIAFVALGALALNMQYLGEGLHTAWLKLPQKATGWRFWGRLSSCARCSWMGARPPPGPHGPWAAWSTSR